MKLIPLVVSTGLFILSVNTFATTQQCPPIPVVASAKFKEAKPLGTAWRFVSKPFTYKKNKWNVFFVLKFPQQETSSNKALQAAQKFYDTQVKFGEPVIVSGDETLPPSNVYPLTCTYYNGSDTYDILAQSPPTEI